MRQKLVKLKTELKMERGREVVDDLVNDILVIIPNSCPL